jgi:hypothetical protein
MHLDSKILLKCPPLKRGHPSSGTTLSFHNRGCRGCDHMVVWFITTYPIGAYHH